MKTVYMIYALKCPHCATMRQTLNSVIKTLDSEVELIAMNCADDEALDFALDHDITDVPACYIDGTVIEGENYRTDDIIKALKKLDESA